MKKLVTTFSALMMLAACVTTTEPQIERKPEAKTVEKNSALKANVNNSTIHSEKGYPFIVCRFNGNVEKMQRSAGDALFSNFGGGFKNFQFNLFKTEGDSLQMIGYSQSVKTVYNPRTPVCQMFSHADSELSLFSAVRNIANFYTLQGGTAHFETSLDKETPSLIFMGHAGTAGFGYKWGVKEMVLSKEVYDSCATNNYKTIINTEKNKRKKAAAEKALNQEVQAKYTEQLDRVACKAAAIAWPAAELSPKQQKWADKTSQKILQKVYVKK